MKIVDKALMGELRGAALASPRLRSHHNLHPSVEDAFHRLCIAVEPGSYIRPHRHANPDRWELLIPVQGSIAALRYNESGEVIGKDIIKAGGECVAIELEAAGWHSFVCLEPGTVVFEIKPGPYIKPPPADFAQWAPEEGQPLAAAFVEWFKKAKIGQRADI